MIQPKIKIYIINLKKDSDRKNHIINQLEKQNIFDYEIIEAVDGNILTKEELNSKVFKDKKGLNYWNTKMSPSQIGCALSHIKIYKKLLKSENNYCLILEDDAIFNQNLTNDLNEFI